MGVGTGGGKVGVDVAAYGVVVKGEPGIVRDIDKYTAAGGVCLDLLRTDIGEDTEISGDAVMLNIVYGAFQIYTAAGGVGDSRGGNDQGSGIQRAAGGVCSQGVSFYVFQSDVSGYTVQVQFFRFQIFQAEVR